MCSGAWNVCTSPLCYTLVARLPSDWNHRASGVSGPDKKLQRNRAHCTWMKRAWKHILQDTRPPGAWIVSQRGPNSSQRQCEKKKKFIFSQQGVGNKCQRASASQGNVQSSGPSCTYLTVLLGVTVWRLSAVIWTDRWLVWNAAPSDLWNDRDVGAPWERPRLVRPLELHEEL